MSWWPFGSKCPVDEKTRNWVDGRMAWLANEFGLENWWDTPLIEPNDTYFPDRFDRSERSVRQMLDRVCGYMGVDPDRIALRLYSEDRHHRLARGLIIQTEGTGTAGTYSREDREVISIETSTTQDASTLVAVMAHELAHARLLGEGRISPDAKDHEPTTDLATVFFGLGLFNANSVVQFQQWSSGSWSGWRSSRIGYLDEPTFGYALAVWAYVRGEQSPRWMRQLRLGPRSAMAQSLRFLAANPGNTLSGRRRAPG